jgi:hypothetical protein
MTEGTVDVRASDSPDDLGNPPQDRRVPHGVQILRVYEPVYPAQGGGSHDGGFMVSTQP